MREPRCQKLQTEPEHRLADTARHVSRTTRGSKALPSFRSCSSFRHRSLIALRMNFCCVLMPVCGCVHAMVLTMRSFNSSGTDSRISTDFRPGLLRPIPMSLPAAHTASSFKSRNGSQAHYHSIQLEQVICSQYVSDSWTTIDIHCESLTDIPVISLIRGILGRHCHEGASLADEFLDSRFEKIRDRDVQEACVRNNHLVILWTHTLG